MNNAQNHNELIHRFERLFFSKNYKKAAQALKLAIQKGAKSGGNYFKLGLAYYLSGDFKNAVKSYGVAVGYSPNKPDYWLYYGEALKKIKCDQEAQSVIAYAQSICDDWEEMRSNFQIRSLGNDAIVNKVQALHTSNRYRQAS